MHPNTQRVQSVDSWKEDSMNITKGQWGPKRLHVHFYLVNSTHTNSINYVLSILQHPDTLWFAITDQTAETSMNIMSAINAVSVTLLLHVFAYVLYPFSSSFHLHVLLSTGRVKYQHCYCVSHCGRHASHRKAWESRKSTFMWLVQGCFQALLQS